MQKPFQASYNVNNNDVMSKELQGINDEYNYGLSATANKVFRLLILVQ
jgi:hypothetical protein